MRRGLRKPLIRPSPGHLLPREKEVRSMISQPAVGRLLVLWDRNITPDLPGAGARYRAAGMIKIRAGKTISGDDAIDLYGLCRMRWRAET